MTPDQSTSATRQITDASPEQVDRSKSLLPSVREPKISYRASILRKAIPRIPQTAEGLPIGYYRVDLLPEEDPSDPNEEIQALRNAYADLSFEYGYPTLFNGRPFWYKLDFEPGFAHAAFQMYLESIQTGPRELTLIAQNPELRNVLSKVRANSINTPKEDGQKSDQESDQGGIQSVDEVLDLVNEFSVLYMWRFRARAHDLYKEAAYRHLKLRRQTTLEDEHYVLASNLLAKLKEKVLESADFFESMPPKVAVDMLIKLIGIQRVSTGLPASGPLPTKDAPEDMTFEMIMRSLGQKAAQSGTMFDGRTGEPTQNVLSEVLQDRATASMMQEVIIRVSKVRSEQNNSEDLRAKGHTFIGRGRGGRQEHSISNEDLNDITPFDLSGAPGANLDEDSDK